MIRAVNAWWDYDSPRLSYAERVDGRRVVREARADLATFVRAEDARAANQALMRSLRESPAIRSVAREERHGDAWIRISWRQADSRKRAEKWFRDVAKIRTYEGDVPAVRRWIVDERVEIQRPLLAFLDLETCARFPMTLKEKHRILCWTLIGQEDGRTRQGVLGADSDEGERAMLVELWRALDDYDQVASWNGDGFDFPVLFARTKRARLGVDARRWLWLDQMALHRKMAISAAESGEEKQSMALNAVASSVLKRGKVEGFPPSEMFPSWEAGGARRDALLNYNLVDVELQRDLEAATGYVDMLDRVCATTRTFADSYGMRPTPQVETLLMLLGDEHGGVKFPTREIRDEGDDEPEFDAPFRGAHVLEPKWRGVARDVHCFDFAAMYPSIIVTWNMSAETIVETPPAPLVESRPLYLSHLPTPKVEPPKRGENQCESPRTPVLFRTDVVGLLPRAIDKMLTLREASNARKATLPFGSPEWVACDRESTGLKQVNNSFFGVAGQQRSRCFEPRVAEAITQTGAWLLDEVVAEARRQKIDVGYGDTDSGMVSGCTDERMAEFVAFLNAEFLPRLAREQGCARCTLKVAYEKKFGLIVFVSAKRYFARVDHYKGTPADENSRPEIKGLEYKRGDSVRIAREAQAELIDLMMGGGCFPLESPRKRVPLAECVLAPEPLYPVVERWRERVRAGALSLDDVVKSQRIARPLKEYASKLKKDGTEGKQPPHVRVAKLLRERGEDVREGTRVAYFTDAAGEVRPASDWAGECDRKALWDEGVWPPVERVVRAAFPGGDWDRFRRFSPPAPAAQGSLFSAAASGAPAPLRLEAARPRHGRSRRSG